MSDQLLAIGQLATSTGVSISTLRYYESRGLIAPTRRVGDKRRFDPTSVERIRFVRRAKAAGFTLDQIRQLLDEQSAKRRALVAARIDELTQARAELDRTLLALEALQDCACDVVEGCVSVAGF